MIKTTTNSRTPIPKYLRAKALAWITPSYEPRPDTSSQVAPILQQGREQLIVIMNRVIFSMGVAIWLVYLAISFNKNLGSAIAFSVVLLLFGMMSLKRVSYRVRSFTTGLAIYIAAVADLTFYGASFVAPLLLFGLSVYTLIFAGRRMAWSILLLSTATFGLLIWLVTAGYYAPPFDLIRPKGYHWGNVVLWPLMFAITTLGSLILVNALLEFVRGAWMRERETTQALAQKTDDLNISLEREQSLAAALKVSLDKEISLNKLRSQAITTISHEFRTPLTAINTSADLLLNYADRLSEEKRNHKLDRIKTSVSKLDTLLSQVTAIEEADLTQQDEYVTLPFGNFSAELAQFIHHQFEHTNNIHIEYDSSDLTPITIERTRTQQLCQLIVSNAVKFGSTHITVCITRQSKQFTLTVEDDGIGIPAAEIKGIYNPFQRGSNANDFQGLGIGLAIANSLITSLNGSINIESDETTSVTITIPIVCSDATPMLIS